MFEHLATMTVPVHVQLISGVLNAVVLIAGVRNIVKPGVPVVVIPDDDVFQLHFHGAAGSNAKMAFVFQLLGGFMLMAAATKLIAVRHAEGTFLRQKLFFALGALDLAVAAVVFAYDALPKSATAGFAALHALEGAAFLADAMMRDRPVKAKGKKK